MSGSSGISTGGAVDITFVMTFIVSVTVTAIITFIVTYCICVMRRFETATQNPKHVHHSQQENMLYEEMELPGSTIIKELQPSSAYGTSHKVKMVTNPAYEGCE